MTDPRQFTEPNFRGKKGELYLIRCFECDPNGSENYPISVPTGQCAYCGWKEPPEIPIRND